MKKHVLVSIALLCLGANTALGQQEDPKQLVDLVKKNLATSMQQLKKNRPVSRSAITALMAS